MLPQYLKETANGETQSYFTIKIKKDPLSPPLVTPSILHVGSCAPVFYLLPLPET